MRIRAPSRLGAMDTRIIVCAALAALACSQGSEAAPPPPPQVVEEGVGPDSWVFLTLEDSSETQEYSPPAGKALVITQTWAAQSGRAMLRTPGQSDRLIQNGNNTASQGDRTYHPGIVVRDAVYLEGPGQVLGYLVDL